MSIDNNFEILEREVDRLVDGLNQLRTENDDLKQKLSESVKLQKKSEDELEVLRRNKEELKTVKENHETVKGRIEGLLERLNKIDSNI